MSMASANVVRAPQQARSRAALQKILVAAEAELSEIGFDAFTMQSVAARAGVSIGAMYRRFTGREQILDAVKARLLGEVVATVTARVELAAGSGLAEVIRAYTGALAHAFGPRSRVVSEIHRHQAATAEANGGKSLRKLELLLLEAAAPYLAEVRRPKPLAAVRFVAQTCLGACVGKMEKARAWSQTESWSEWATEIAEMAILYLGAPATKPRPEKKRLR